MKRLISVIGVLVLLVAACQPVQDASLQPQPSSHGCLLPSSNDQPVEIPYQGILAYSYSAHLYTLDFATEEIQEFTGTKGMVNPDWSPNGRYIAFGRGNIYALDFDIKDVLTLITSSDTIWDPSWSLNGQKLVYTKVEGKQGLYILDFASEQISRLNLSLRSPFHPSWSPDGKTITFVADDERNISQIYLVDVETCLLTQVCETIQLTWATEGNNNYAPAWSPDGNQIVFASNRDGFYAIYVMEKDGTNQRRLTNHIYGDNDPTWSPDGRYIAFTRWSLPIGDIGSQTDLFIMHTDGTEVQCITEKGRQPDWWMDRGVNDTVVRR